MSNSETTLTSPNRRTIIKAGAGTLAVLAGLGADSRIQAQGTPEAEMDMAGMFGVTRSFVIKDDASVDELNAIVEGFVEIVSANPEFISYNVIFDESTRGYVSVGIFDNAESAQASVENAVQYIADHNLADYYVDPQPVIVQGAIVVSAGA